MVRIRLRSQVIERPGHIKPPHRGLDGRHAPGFAAAICEHPVGFRSLELFSHQLPETVRPLADFVHAVLRLPDLDTVDRGCIEQIDAQ